MRKINVNKIIDKVKEMCIKANYELGGDVLKKLYDARDREQSPIGRDILDKLILNANIAKNEQMSICQDTGMAVFFVEIGQDVYIESCKIKQPIG
ncbi:fumarate hydratase [Caloranaerobacter azorensis]|nr:fumarate hydratase [Caloranaerobacter azorensis]